VGRTVCVKDRVPEMGYVSYSVALPREAGAEMALDEAGMTADAEAASDRAPAR
jgi:hypothetical protein